MKITILPFPLFLSSTTLSHPVQNLSTPIVVQIIPINDNDPVVTVEMTETYYRENAPPQPVLPDITVTDEDVYCENDQLSAAIVQVNTLTKDSPSDQLTVRVTIFFIGQGGPLQYRIICIQQNPTSILLVLTIT